MKKKLTTVLAGAVAATMMMGMAVSADEIAVMVPSADHGWTGAVLSYAQEKVDEINEEGTYSAKLYAATDVENQIQQVDDLLANTDGLSGIVILPYNQIAYDGVE